MAFDMILSSDSAVVCLHLCVLREDIHFVRVFYKERLWIYSVMQSDGNSFYGDVEFLVLISFFFIYNFHMRDTCPGTSKKFGTG